MPRAKQPRGHVKASDSFEKVALITGAGSGIGRSVAVALAREGYALALCGRRSELLEETGALARKFRSDARILVAPADVRDSASVENLFAEVRKTFGRL